MSHNKRKQTLRESELPIETVLNPGLIVMKDGTWKPVDLMTDPFPNEEESQQA